MVIFQYLFLEVKGELYNAVYKIKNFKYIVLSILSISRYHKKHICEK